MTRTYGSLWSLTSAVTTFSEYHIYLPQPLNTQCIPKRIRSFILAQSLNMGQKESFIHFLGQADQRQNTLCQFSSITSYQGVNTTEMES